MLEILAAQPQDSDSACMQSISQAMWCPIRAFTFIHHAQGGAAAVVKSGTMPLSVSGLLVPLAVGFLSPCTAVVVGWDVAGCDVDDSSVWQHPGRWTLQVSDMCLFWLLWHCSDDSVRACVSSQHWSHSKQACVCGLWWPCCDNPVQACVSRRHWSDSVQV